MLLEELQESLHTARMSLRRNRGRTVLTMLGVIVGITAVIMVLSAGAWLEGFVVGQVETFGSNYVQVEVKVPATAHASSENAQGQAAGITITTLKDADVDAIAQHPNIESAYGGVLGQEVATYKEENETVFLFGVNAPYIDIDQGEVEYGRFFTEDEDRSLSRVVVLGSSIADTLFGGSDPIGQNIKLGRSSYKVIGVMKERGGAAFIDFDAMIYLPLNTLQKRVMGIDYISFLVAQAKDVSLLDVTAEDVRQIMREQHGTFTEEKEDFAVTTSEEALDLLNTIVGGITLLLIAIASISLIVGGVGIMNIMYVSVSERTFEIGLRKSVGATKFNILMQFLMEAVFITFIGGVVGVSLGVGLSFLASLVATAQGFDWDYSISIFSLLLAAGMAVVVGLISGYYPARKAARMDPIVALRQE